MHRDPPPEVKAQLRKEVGFGCPVPDCGCPYLEWHHFDPPWRIRHHHDADGMIALCRVHHIQADNGAFEDDQLRDLKRNSPDEKIVRGRFEWMRRKLLAVVGGNLYYECATIFRYKGARVVWLNRDLMGYLLLNLQMPSSTGESRAGVTDNNWYNTGLEDDIESPPSARRVAIRYAGGDELSIEFYELDDPDKLTTRHPQVPRKNWEAAIEFPITAVEVTCHAPSLAIDLGAKLTDIEKMRVRGGFIAQADCAIDVD